MMDLPPPPKFWTPPKPAIIRAAELPKRADFYRGIRRAHRDGAGFMPVFCPAGQPRVTSLAFQSQVSVSATAITVPSAAAGDIAILFDAAINSTTTPPTSVLIAGFTQVGDVSIVGGSGNAGRTILSYKVLASGDLGASLTGMAGSSTARKIMMVIRPNVAASVITISSYQQEATAGNPTLQTITAGVAPCVLIGSARGSAAVTESGTLTASPGVALTSLSTVQAAYYAIYNSAPANLTFDMNDVGEFNMLQTFCMAVA